MADKRFDELVEKLIALHGAFVNSSAQDHSSSVTAPNRNMRDFFRGRRDGLGSTAQEIERVLNEVGIREW